MCLINISTILAHFVLEFTSSVFILFLFFLELPLPSFFISLPTLVGALHKFKVITFFHIVFVTPDGCTGWRRELG